MSKYYVITEINPEAKYTKLIALVKINKNNCIYDYLANVYMNHTNNAYSGNLKTDKNDKKLNEFYGAFADLENWHFGTEKLELNYDNVYDLLHKASSPYYGSEICIDEIEAHIAK